MSSALLFRVGLSRAWLITQSIQVAMLMVFGLLGSLFYWHSLIPSGLSIIGMTVPLAIFIISIYLMRRIIQLYHRIKIDGLEVTEEAVRLNGVTIPLSKIHAVILGTSLVGDVPSALKGEIPRYAEGSPVWGPRLHLFVKDLDFSNEELRRIWEISNRSHLSPLFSTKDIVLGELTFSAPLKTIKEQIDLAMKNRKRPC